MGTIDLKIQNRCDHTVLNERLYLDDDLRSLPPQFPIASQGYVQLFRFGLQVPESRYSFVKDNETLFEDKYFKIYLNLPDMYIDPMYEINYSVPSAFCPKCLSSDYVDDIGISSKNEVEQVTNAYSLIQSVEKAIITARGTNRYYPWAGSGLNSLVGTKINDISLLSQEITAQVRSSLENLKATQIKHQGMNPLVASDEVLNTIETVDVAQDLSDPTVVEIYVQYTSQSGASYDMTQLMNLAKFRTR
jgi:hypothetical protein